MEKDEKLFTPPAYDEEERTRWPVVAVLVGALIIVMCCVCGAGIGLGVQLA